MTILRNHLLELYEYLLVINPYGIVWEKIMAEKKYLFSLCQAEMALYGKPHITLANFMALGMAENKLLEILREIGSKQYAFEVILKDYNHFQTHTIYADIENKIPFKHLAKMLKADAYDLMKSHAADKPFIGSNAHLTISRRLSEEQFAKSWGEFKYKKISEKFDAEEMYLLRRPAIEKSKYDNIGCFKFNGNPPTNNLTGGTQLSFFA